MDCATVKSRLGGLVSGTLTPEEKVETASHLASCEGCRLEHHLLQAIHGTGSSGVPVAAAPTVSQPPPPVLESTEPPLTLESMAPAMSAPDPEVSFADVGLTAPALSPDPPARGRIEDHPTTSTGAALPAKRAWDFEPADPPRASSPPEESLTFAEEALNRSSRRQGSRALFRVVLWTGGAVSGVALLAVSVWMAMAHKEPVDDPQSLVPPPSHAADSLAARSGAPGGSAATPGGSAAPISPPVSAQPAPAAMTPASGRTGAARMTLPDSRPLASPSSSSPSTAASPRAAEPPALETAPSPSPPRGGPPTREEGFEPVTDGPADTKAAWSQSDLAPAPKKAAAASRPPLVVESAPEEARPATPLDESDTRGPVGRLHLATAKAHEEHDLDALRRIKTSWKSYLRTALGSERERSKRELADCLWAVQEITGRDADRREALAAYREYVLHAPAGGADARTVSRMRYLEDVLQ